MTVRYGVHPEIDRVIRLALVLVCGVVACAHVPTVHEPHVADDLDIATTALLRRVQGIPHAIPLCVGSPEETDGPLEVQTNDFADAPAPLLAALVQSGWTVFPHSRCRFFSGEYFAPDGTKAVSVSVGRPFPAPDPETWVVYIGDVRGPFWAGGAHCFIVWNGGKLEVQKCEPRWMIYEPQE
jgi:hypothetical protein